MSDLRFGCPLDESCTAGNGHEGDCVTFQSWPGLPDPHRHNPLGVAIVLGILLSGWIACFAIAGAFIFGARL